MSLSQRLSIYGYLFLPELGDIVEYRIELVGEEFLIYKGELDSLMEQYFESQVWRSTMRLDDAIKHVVLDLLALPKQKESGPSIFNSELPQAYVPMIFEIQDAAEDNRLSSVVMIGDSTSYNDDGAVQSFLQTFGFDDARTIAPAQYLFGDFQTERNENKALVSSGRKGK